MAARCAGSSRSWASRCAPRPRRPAPRAGRDGAVAAMEFADGDRRSTPTSSSSPTGVRPRDELAREAGCAIGERGGVVVDDGCLTEDPDVCAIGEVACIQGRTCGLVGSRLHDGRGRRGPAARRRRDVPGRGPVHQAQAARRRRRQLRRRVRRDARRLEVVYADPVAGVYKKLVMSRRRADAARRRARRRRQSRTRSLRPDGRRRARRRPDRVAAARGHGARRSAATLPDDANVCSCNNVTAGTIRGAVTDHGLHRRRRGQGLHQGRHRAAAPASAGQEADGRRAGGGGRRGQHGAVRALRASAGPSCSTSSRVTRDHDLQRAHRPARHRPRLRHLPAGRRLDPGLARQRATCSTASRRALQDTNDHVMANLQKDGTYSVVPRIPGGEVTPAGLIAIGQVAAGLRALHQDHRRPAHRPVRRPHRAAARDLEAARRRRLRVRARLRQVAAHREVVRRLDLVPVRRAGLGRRWRSTSSCATAACARRTSSSSASPAAPGSAPRPAARTSASSRPRRAGTCTSAATAGSRRGTRSCSPRTSTTETLVQTIDRFLMYYVRTADRLQRTAPWLEAHRGRHRRRTRGGHRGQPRHLRRPRRRDGRARRQLPRRMGGDSRGRGEASRFVSFVNAPETPDPDLVYVEERGQRRPADEEERAVLIAGASIAGARPEVVA